VEAVLQGAALCENYSTAPHPPRFV